MSTDVQWVVAGLAVGGLSLGYLILGIKWPKWLSTSFLAKIYGPNLLRFLAIVVGSGGLLGGIVGVIYGIIGLVSR